MDYVNWLRSCFSGESDWNAESQSGVDQVTNEQSFYLNASIFQWGSPIS